MALGDRHAVHDELAAAIERVLDRPLSLAPHHQAGIALLAARLRIRRGAVEDDLDGLADALTVKRGPSANQYPAGYLPVALPEGPLAGEEWVVRRWNAMAAVS